MNNPTTRTATPEQVIKILLADPKDRIQLDDHVTELLRSTLATLGSDRFANSSVPTAETIASQLKRYEEATADLLTAVVLLGRWGLPEHRPLLEKILLRLAEANKSVGGSYVFWSAMRWYPLSLLIYGAGMAALSAQNYTMFGPLFQSWLPSEHRRGARDEVTVRVQNQMNELSDAFKMLAGHERDYVPRSEHFFVVLREPLDRMLFLGDGYERLFDEFEIISALAFADLTYEERQRVWAAPGRFGYKSRSSGGPYTAFVENALRQGDDWPLLKLGLFRSSAARFQEIAKGYTALLSQMNWY